SRGGKAESRLSSQSLKSRTSHGRIEGAPPAIGGSSAIATASISAVSSGSVICPSQSSHPELARQSAGSLGEERSRSAAGPDHGSVRGTWNPWTSTHVIHGGPVIWAAGIAGDRLDIVLVLSRVANMGPEHAPCGSSFREGPFHAPGETLPGPSRSHQRSKP